MAFINENLNVFNMFPYRKRYYLFHPWTFLAHLWECLKAAKSRIIKGYCDSDVWDMDTWFCIVVPNMLRTLCKKGIAYPDGRFKTLEEWHDHLQSIADLLEASCLDADEQNEYAEKFYNTRHNDPNYGEIREKYLDRREQIVKEQQIMCISAMKNFSDLISLKMLWD